MLHLKNKLFKKGDHKAIERYNSIFLQEQLQNTPYLPGDKKQ